MNDRAAEVEDIAALAARFGLAFVRDIPEGALDPELVRDLPVEWARTHVLLPIRGAGGGVVVLTADPRAAEKVDYVGVLLKTDATPVLAPREVILSGVERCYFSKTETPGDFLRSILAAGEGVALAIAGDDLLRSTREAPVSQLVNLVLLEAVKRGASDIHLEPFETRLRVRYRIDGVLYEQPSPPKSMEDAIVSRIKVMGRLDIAERRLPQDGMAKVRVGEREIDVRVSTVPIAAGERVVLRLLDRASALLPLTALGMRDEILAGFLRLLSQRNGIVIVAGPTGSGKTTTLYAALTHLDAGRRNIMTIEDPIEYQLPDIGQIQVKPKIGLTFASGLRHVLRQDPDTILVGETRDAETAEVAMRASLTGHLVFTTLHTNDAPGAVVRLLDMGVEPFLVASCLRGVLSQRLVRRLCPVCRAKRSVAAGDAAELGEAGLALTGREVYASAGCAACLEGYRGRVGLFELLVLDADMQQAVRSSPADASVLQSQMRRRGVRTLLDDGVDKLLAGDTSLQELLSAVSGP